MARPEENVALFDSSDSRRERLSRSFTWALRSLLATAKSLHVDSERGDAAVGDGELIFNVIFNVVQAVLGIVMFFLECG